MPSGAQSHVGLPAQFVIPVGGLTLVAETLQSYATVWRGAFLPASDSRTYSQINLGFWSGLELYKKETDDRYHTDYGIMQQLINSTDVKKVKH